MISRVNIVGTNMKNKNCQKMGQKHAWEVISKTEKQISKKCAICHINIMIFSDVNESVIYE